MGEAHAWRVRVALAIVYLVWGTSYLATKIMVTDEPPLVAAGLRFLLAGALLLMFAWWRSGPPVLTRIEWRHMVVMGLLAVLFSNACQVIAMQHVQSNTAALLNATPALWIAWLGTFGHRRSHLTGTARLGLLIGFVGVMLVLAPQGGFDLAGIGWQLLILLGCFSWSLGTIYYRNSGSANPPVMFTALQMLAGALGLLAAAAIAGEPFDVHWTPRGLFAFTWLALMSACLGYSAYVWLATHTTPVVVGSYGYVNPAVAALVGWLVLGEKLAWMQITGMLVILLGVALATGYLTPMPRPFAETGKT
jgi:drug/metabolite transporter (DMT)-like permease